MKNFAPNTWSLKFGARVDNGRKKGMCVCMCVRACGPTCVRVSVAIWLKPFGACVEAKTAVYQSNGFKDGG